MPELTETLVDKALAGNKALIEELTEALDAARASTVSIEQINEEGLPMEFVGLIRHYRFDNDEDKAPNGMPAHHFEVDCGEGLWLHVSVGSDKFDPFFAQTNISIGSLNNQLVKVRRDLEYGRLVPVEILAALARDIDNRPLWTGCRAKAVKDDNRIVTVLRAAPDAGGRRVVVGRYLDGSERGIYAGNLKRLSI